MSMLPFVFYLLKVTICSGILFGYYWFVLRNKSFHQYNRFYLLSSVVLALVLPLIQINIWHDADQPAPQAIQLLQAVSSDEYLDEIIITSRQATITSDQVLVGGYTMISGVLLVFFIHTLIKIRHLFKKHRHSLVDDVFFVNTTAKGTPFSFLKYIFWNDHIDPESPAGNQVFRHELAHVQQKHSHDKLLMHVVLIFCWSNPIFWLIRKELNMIHEFLADQIAVEDNDTAAFAAMILQAAYPLHRFHPTNPFFYSPIKRRLMMLTKKRNRHVGYIGRLLALPLTVLIFAAFTLKIKTFQRDNVSAYIGKTITVVIDAGHGGADGGSTNAAGTVREKDLNLAITQTINAMNTNKNLHIVLTRRTDVFQSVQERAAFTKAAKADLFISIHMNASPATVAAPSGGLNFYVSNKQAPNLPASQLLASALIQEFNQQHALPVNQQPLQAKTSIRVLQDAGCPAVLIEAGNINNNKDLGYIQTAAGKKLIADKILSAIQKWATARDGGETGTGTLALTGAASKMVTKPNDTLPKVTLKNGEKALVIADGKTISHEALKNIDPENIETVQVLKDKYATDKYGERGKDGVIIITTKKVKANNKQDARVIIQSKDSGAQVMLSNLQGEIKTTHIHKGTPLYVIDGKVAEETFDIKSLDPNEIESINVIKDQKAVEKYGSKAINGVIEITTKEKKKNIETTQAEPAQPKPGNGKD